MTAESVKSSTPKPFTPQPFAQVIYGAYGQDVTGAVPCNSNFVRLLYGYTNNGRPTIPDGAFKNVEDLMAYIRRSNMPLTFLTFNPPDFDHPIAREVIKTPSTFHFAGFNPIHAGQKFIVKAFSNPRHEVYCEANPSTQSSGVPQKP